MLSLVPVPDRKADESLIDWFFGPINEFTDRICTYTYTESEVDHNLMAAIFDDGEY